MASPTVLPENAAVSDVPSAKLPLLSLVLAIVVAVCVCVALLGGAAFYLVRSGRVPLMKTAADEGKTGSPTAAPPTHVMVLEPMVANLSDAGGAAYLKVALTLRIADGPAAKDAPARDAKAAKGISDAEAGVRDTVLTVVGQQASDQLLAADGKERLKSALKTALGEHNPELKVMDLYFVDFLVQR